MQSLGLVLVLVYWVHDGSFELALGVAGSILGMMLDGGSRPFGYIERTRMFGVSLLSPAISFARNAVAAKVRTAAREQLVERATAPNGRATASRIAIV